MNYLAHLMLADPDPDLLVGAIAGDFVRGRIDHLPLPPALREGVRLHRLTDVYTDQHPVTARSRARFQGARRRYAGIIVDLAYDHFLARHWSRYAADSLGDFTDRAYRVLLDHAGPLPPAMQQLLPRMAAQDWLGSYREIENVVYALERIGGRLRRENGLLDVAPELARAYPGLEEDFLAFFPDLMAAARDWRQGLEGG